MITFAHPWFFLLLIPVILLGWYMAVRKRPSVKVPTVQPFKAASGRKHRLTIMEFSMLIAAILLTTALARPQKELDSRIIRGEGVDIILALDISGSMASYDRPEGMTEAEFYKRIQKKNIVTRLENAKTEIRKFIESRPNDRIGLIGFADLAYSFVPPTVDHDILLARLKDLTPGYLGSSTGIAPPVGTAAKQLQNAPSPRRVLVLFTDGANTAENRVTPQAAAQAAKEFNIMIHTVGIGSKNTYVPYYGRLVPAKSDLDEKLLRELSGISGGNFYRANDNAGMKQVMQEINQLERTDNQITKYAEYREFAPILLLLAAAVILCGSAIAAAGRVRVP